MKGYKVFNPDWSCKAKQYSCPGIFEQKGKLKLCKNGIHFCKELIDCFKYYEFNPKNKVAEIEAIGEIIEDEIGEKYCTSKIKIIRELNWHEVLDLVNIGKNNTGFNNTGDYNSGKYNSGNYNISGYNTGSNNSGYCNSGSKNSGNYNSGYYNSGKCNSGDYNSGDYNSGDYNTGHHNSGDYNSGDGSFGCFNTGENKMIFFNKPSDWTYKDWVGSNAREVLNKIMKSTGHLSWVYDDRMTKEEKDKYPEYKTTKGYLKQRGKEELNSLRQEWWKNVLSEEEKEYVLNLPNFDADIFKEITGIDVSKLSPLD